MVRGEGALKVKAQLETGAFPLLGSALAEGSSELGCAPTGLSGLGCAQWAGSKGVKVMGDLPGCMRLQRRRGAD